MKYADPTGHWLESGLDIISLGATLKDINDNGLNWENGIGLAADVVSLAAPGVAGGGTVVRYADDAYAAGKAGVSTAWDWGKQALGYGDEATDTAVDAGKAADNIPCPVNSFSAETLVATETGLQPITEVGEGELVYAYNEATGEVGLYPVTDEIAHLDHEIVTVVIEGERIYTTPEHPFSVNGQWIDAGNLSVGDLVRRLDGSTGDVEAITIEERPQVMYNLTVADAHTFFVGEQQWLVHNCSALKYWNESAAFDGTKVFQRNNLFDIGFVDSAGRTNLQRMKAGLAPIGNDGESVVLHHLIQTSDSALVELSATMHRENTKMLHINPNTIPSGIDRRQFDSWRRQYWKNRAKDIEQ